MDSARVVTGCSQRHEGWICVRTAYDDGGSPARRWIGPLCSSSSPTSRQGGSTRWSSTRALGLLLTALILSAPVIAFVMVVTVEMLTDLMAKMGATAVWPVAAAAVGWVLLRKYGWQPWTSRLRSEGA